VAAQDVAELVPRVRRAIEGPTPDATVADSVFVPVAADAVGDLILVTWLRDMKVSERIQNESQQWEWTKSATALRDWLKLVQSQRDAALEALEQTYPVMVRVRSFLAVRDAQRWQVVQAVEPWLSGGTGGNQLEPAPIP
jgi:hypothetical protein